VGGQTERLRRLVFTQSDTTYSLAITPPLDGIARIAELSL
jgi:hypothetical protein